MMKKISFLCLILLTLTACAGESIATDEPVLDATLLMRTAAHLATEDYMLTQRSIPTLTDTPVSTETLIPTLDRTRPPAQTPTPELACDQAGAGHPIDITIPDGTVMTPGESFSKTWRLENVGSCTWTRLYAVTFFSGNGLSAVQINPILGEVDPGEVIDVTVDMEAPQTAGVYQSNWMLTNADGIMFGIGPNGDAPFWVQIEVVQTITETPQPTPTVTPTPVVYLTGDAVMGNGDQLDLDTAELNPADLTNADFIYQFDGATEHVLMTMNGTQWMVYGDDQPNFGDCQDAQMSGNAISFTEVPLGTYLCYRTSGSLPGRLQFDGFEAEQISISFLTWAVP